MMTDPLEQIKAKMPPPGYGVWYVASSDETLWLVTEVERLRIENEQLHTVHIASLQHRLDALNHSIALLQALRPH
jgi:hypothetical protein